MLTVLFETPFWVGIYERHCGQKYEVCKILFGSEPKDYEVYEYIMRNWNKLRFSPSTECESSEQKRTNPKRMQREIVKGLRSTGIGTKAQQALKQWYEQNKQTRRKTSRRMREEHKQQLFELKQEKRKEKHKGH